MLWRNLIGWKKSDDNLVIKNNNLLEENYDVISHINLVIKNNTLLEGNFDVISHLEHSN